MKKIFAPVVIFSLMFALSQCRKPEPLTEESYDERLSGGSQTAFDATSHAFSNPFGGLSEYEYEMHNLGDAAFEKTFITAPASTNSGLGPAFNNVSCKSCHHNDGIGVPTAGDPQSSLLMRISVTNMKDVHGGALAVPGYGTQVQDKSVFGKQPEATVNITYSYQQYSFADGETYELRTPTYTLSNLYIPINGSYLLSPRLAPPVFGLGLLEAIPEDQIVANADANDADGNGISGKPNYVWDPHTQTKTLGRFGLKSNTASVITQVAAAFNNDIGITSFIFPKETIYGQSQNDQLNDDPEIDDYTLNAVKFYMETLQVPARRNVSDAQVIKGKEIFLAAKCESCHKQTFTTAVNVAFPQLSNQRIHPYTDLLVHDMGAGLADNRPDFDADGNEWRTSPLWGVGLFEVVNYPAYYLHDGRARTLIEAIMWHGGEAQHSKEYVQQLSKTDRDALLKFLRSL